MKENLKKYIIIAIIIALIILGIIWYRNDQKKKAEELAKQKLTSAGTPPIDVVTSDIGKTAFVKGSTKFFNTNDMTVAYTKTVNGEFAGNVQADQTSQGSIAFYKIVNTSGKSYYVLKSQVTVK